MKKNILKLLCCTIAACIMFTGCSLFSNDEPVLTGAVVATVNGEEITTSEYNYFLMMSMYNEETTALSESGEEKVSDDFWTEEKIADVMQDALDQCVLTHVYRTSAMDNGIEMSDEDLQMIDDNIASGAEYYGSEENFDMFFESQGLTRELYKELNIRSYYASKYFEKFSAENISDDDIMKTFKQEYVKAKHILISKTDEENGADISAEAYSKIEDIKANLDGGADFDTLMNEYCEDPGVAQNPDGYVFTKGEMVAEFEEAAFALEPGQMSDIVETSYGYHIIKKVELTDNDLNATTTDAYGNQLTIRDAVKSLAANEPFNELLESEKEKADVDINDAEYKKFAENTAEIYNNFINRSNELSIKLNEIMKAAAETATGPTEETSAAE